MLTSHNSITRYSWRSKSGKIIDSLLNVSVKEKKELKDELVKAYEMEMIEVEDINVIKETSEEDFEYYQALEKGINTGKE